MMEPGRVVLETLKPYFDGVCDLQLYRNIPNETVDSLQRLLETKDALVRDAVDRQHCLGILRASQADYVGLSGVHTASATWSLEVAEPEGVDIIRTVYARMIDELTERVLTVRDGDQTWRVALTFVSPTKYMTETISGVIYQQLVLGGRAVISDVSSLANDFGFTIDGAPADGIISYSFAAMSSGEAFQTPDSGLGTETAVDTVVKSLSVDVHAVKDSPLALMADACVIGDGMTANGVRTFAIRILRDGRETLWANAKLETATLSGSIGSYVLLNLKFTEG